MPSSTSVEMRFAMRNEQKWPLLHQSGQRMCWGTPSFFILVSVCGPTLPYPLSPPPSVVLEIRRCAQIMSHKHVRAHPHARS